MDTVDNGLAAALLAVVTVALTLISARLNRGAARPVVVHNLIWIAVLFLLGSQLIVYREASVAAWVTLALGIVYFNIGSWLGSAFALSKHGEQKLAHRVRLIDQSLGLLTPRLFGLLLVCYTAGYAVYLAVISSRFGLITLISNPAAIRGAQGESYLASVPLWARLLLYLGPLIFAIAVVPHSLTTKFPLLPRILVAAAVGVSLLSLLQRTNLVAGILFSAAALMALQKLTRTKEQPASAALQRRNFFVRAPLLSMVLLAAGALAVFQAVALALGKTGSNQNANSAVSDILHQSGLFSIYSYFTAGVPAFLSLTESRNSDWPPDTGLRVIYGDYNPQTWGAATFEQVLSFVPGFQTWNPIAPFTDVGTVTNVYTWFEPLYRDFREPGVAIGALMVGAIISYLFSTRFLSPGRYWGAAIAFSTVYLATFVPKYNSSMYVALIVLVLLIDVVRRSNPDGSNPGGRGVGDVRVFDRQAREFARR